MNAETVGSTEFGETAKSAVDLVKDALSIVRDLFLMILFVGWIFFPSFRTFLASVGVKGLNLGFATMTTQAKEAAQDTNTAAQSVSDAIKSLNTIAATSKDPVAKQSAADAVTKLNGSLNTLDSANSKLATAVAAGNSQAAAPASTVEGWLYLGEADHTQTRWMNPPQPKVNSASPAFKSGDKITLNDDVFLHADKGTNQTFNQAPIVTAIPANTTVTVLDEQPSPAVNGGVFIWAKIQLTR